MNLTDSDSECAGLEAVIVVRKLYGADFSNFSAIFTFGETTSEYSVPWVALFFFLLPFSHPNMNWRSWQLHSLQCGQ